MSVVVGASLPTALTAFTQSNAFRVYDSALRMPVSKQDKFRIGFQAEYGDRSTGRNWDDCRRNVLALHDDNQSALAMLDSAVGDVAKNTKLMDVNSFVNVFLPRGLERTNNLARFQLTGDYEELNTNLWATYKLPFKKVPGTLAVSLYVPINHKKIDHVRVEDLTPTDAAELNRISPILPGAVMMELNNRLLNDIKGFAKEVGNLDLNDWDETNLGDITLMLHWFNKYRQDKEYLKKVGIFAKLGVAFPSSEEKDEDKAFSMPSGNDGAWGLPLGLGIDLDFVHNIRAGIDVDFLILFDKTRDRRMKTTRAQTEFFLLNKGSATKEYGLTWQFHLYLQWFHFFRGLSLKTAYQFVKRDDDRLVPKGNDFDFTIVNTAHSLQEFASHNIVFMANYDFFKERKKCFVRPQVSLFYKLPVGGKNLIDTHTFGGQLAINF